MFLSRYTAGIAGIVTVLSDSLGIAYLMFSIVRLNETRVVARGQVIDCSTATKESIQRECLGGIADLQASLASAIGVASRAGVELRVLSERT